MKSKVNSLELSVHSVKAVCRVLWAVFQYTLKNIPFNPSATEDILTPTISTDGGV
jgi:hypothetical protein